MKDEDKHDEHSEHSEGHARRKVYVSRKALVEVYDADGDVVSSAHVSRNVIPLIEHLGTLDPSSVCGIYLVEDEEVSDPPGEGEERLRSPLLPPVADRDGNPTGSSERIVVAEAMSRLMEAEISPQVAMAQVHDMFDRMAATSPLDGGVITLVFGGRPAGFAYINSCRDVPASSMGTLYEAARSQVEQLKENLRSMCPRLVFSDDEEPLSENPIVLPDGSVPSDRGVVTPAEAAREAEERGLTRVVRIED